MASYLSVLTALRDKGLNVLVLAHSQIERFEDPERDSYDRFTPKLHKSSSAIMREWADEVLFASWKVYTRKAAEGFNRERSLASGSGERILRTIERPAHAAKNRLGLPYELPLDFAAYSEFLNGVSTSKPKTKGKTTNG
jgi:hypothetical protein